MPIGVLAGLVVLQAYAQTSPPAVTLVSPTPLVGPLNPGVFFTGTFVISGQNFQGATVTTDGPLNLTGSPTINSTGTSISQAYSIGCCAPQQGQSFRLLVTTPNGAASITDTITLSATNATCIVFPAGFIPFSSISYVTAADAAGDHLVVGVPAPGALALISAKAPLPAFPNQTFCDPQVQLASQQFYPNVYVPTAAELSGDFSAFNGLLTIPGSSQTYTGGIIPASQLNSVFAWRISPAQAPSGNGVWSPTGTMAYARTESAAVLLPSGKVFVAGGCYSCGAELFDPATGTFSPASPPGSSISSIATFSSTATLLQDGRVLIVGGQIAPSVAEIYDPISGKFSALPATMQPRYLGFTATLLNDGRVLIVGGANPVFGMPNSAAELFDPSKDAFTAIGPMSQKRYYHTATLLPSGRVLVANGISVFGTGSTNYNSVEIFDPATGNFTPTGSTYAPRAGGYAVALPNGKVLVAGGDDSDGPATAELFDPATGTFTLTGTPLAGVKSFPSATLLPNGQVLVSGGVVVSGGQATGTTSSELYIPASASFTVATSTIVAREGDTSTLVPDGRVLAIGGNEGDGVNGGPSFSSAELYTPVTQGLVTSQTGLTFRVASGSAVPPPQTVAVLSNTAAIPWTVSTHIFEGANWLSASATGGNSAPGATPTNLTITVNPSGLAAQDYYGAVTLTPTDGMHPPVTIAIVLNIVPAGSPAAPAVSPSGLLFLGVPGTALNSQSFTITNLTSTPLTFSGAGSTTPRFFSFIPASGTINAAQSAAITVTPNLTGLTAGVYNGSIKLTFGDGSTSTVQLLLVLSTTPGSTTAVRPHAAAACTPSKLLPVFTTIGTGFNAPAAWPTSLVVDVVDDCGNTFNAGSVIVSFTDGDPPINLLSTGKGNWAGTWVPQHNAAGFTVRADAQALPLSGSVAVTGQVSSNPTVPVVTAGGVVSSGDFASPPALGLLVSIFGSGLADAPVSGTLPLQSQLGSTSVLLSGGNVLPLLYASDSVINVMIPFDAAANATYQLYVQRGNAISVPVSTAIFSASPTILSTNGSGAGQGHVYVIGTGGVETLADQNATATAGNPVVIYCVGLGAVSPSITAGAITPPAYFNAVAPVTVTFGNQTVAAGFAGLTPGLAGLYQVNVNVPPGVTPGNQVPVTISVGGKSSSSSIFMAVH